MKRALRNLVPSMFNRRLLLLAVGAMLMVLTLAAKLASLTLVEGAARREIAENVLRSTNYIPTVRGNIVDRKSRVLAGDKASYDVAIHYSVLSGEWAYQQAQARAREANPFTWSEMGFFGREQQIQRYIAPYHEQMRQFWQTFAEVSGIEMEELDQRRAAILSRVQQMAAGVWVNRQSLARRDGASVTLRDVAGAIREQRDFHALLPSASAQLRVRVGQFIAEASSNADLAVWRQVQLVDSHERVYPYEKMAVEVDLSSFPGALAREETIEVTLEGVALHTLGAMRAVSQQDVQTGRAPPFRQTDGADLAGYRPTDPIGAWGVESSRESTLRGGRGMRVLDRVTGQPLEEVRPKRGSDVQVTLDIYLQARIEALMSHDAGLGLMRRQPWHARDISPDVLGDALNGSAIVMDVDTGEILAAVSVPGISRRQLREQWRTLAEDEKNLPLWNRPVKMPYEPGSTVKPLVFVAAVSDHKVGYDETIDCRGALDERHPEQLRCWIYKYYFPKTHGPLTGIEAIQHSCNIYFYTMGRRLGAPRLAWWFSQWGMGRPVGCGLEEEAAGDLPRFTADATADRSSLTLSAATNMGIGQGPVRWTLMQTANAFGILARGGRVLPPTFFKRSIDDLASLHGDVHLDLRAAQLALRGMDEAANNPQGTAHHLSLVDREKIFNIEDLKVFAKSGTADTGKAWVTHADGRRSFEPRGDHAWTICFAQPSGAARPRYFVAVVVEHAGSGANVAGPVVNQILHAMRAEGYL